MKQQFEASIKHAIDKGFNMFGWDINGFFGWKVKVFNGEYFIRITPSDRDYSISDIYASHSFWKAIAGEEMVCSGCGCYEFVNRKLSLSLFAEDCCIECQSATEPIPAYLYHIAECAKLFSPEEQTDYVSKVIKGVEK